MCFNGSGYKLFNGGNQQCEDCCGSGMVTKAKYDKLKKKYDDLIKTS